MSYKIVIITVTLISLVAISCKQNPMEKPFIVIHSDPYISSTEYSRYEYQDKNGTIRSFYDEKGKFKVGDTLK